MRKLTHMGAVEIARLLEAREVSSVEVTRAHLARIDELDPKLRAFATVFHGEATAAAQRADEERRRGEARGPLHGMPISIKESLDCQGHASTLGVSTRKKNVAREDAGVVSMARSAGAVILGRTNLAELLLFHESDNPLFGRSNNPWSLAHTPGGSSGGEAAAIAAGLSPLGFGTDVGGSIRVPAHFAGIAGLKPTLDRWTNLGSNSALVGQEATRSQLGPMARTARDVAFFFRALDPVAMTAIDPRVPPLAMGDPAAVDVAKLRVGVFAGDEIVPLALSVRRALDEAAMALRRRVAEVVEIHVPGSDDAIFAYLATMSADGGKTTAPLLEGEEVHPTLRSLRAIAKLGATTRGVLAAAAGAAGQKVLQRSLSSVGERSVAEYWRFISELRAFRARLFDAMRAAKLDVLLAPPHATAALPHGASKNFVLAGGPSILFNIAQFPAGVVPVTIARADEARREGSSRDLLTRAARAVDERSAGLPIGVQVVGLPWEEDKVLATMIALEDALVDRPKTPVEPRERETAEGRRA